MIERQDGDRASHRRSVAAANGQHTFTRIAADRAGVVTTLDAFLVGRASVALGAGRDKKGDPVDFAAGLRVLRKPGERVSAGDPVLELHYNDPAKLPGAVALVARTRLRLATRRRPRLPLVIGWVYDGGETRASRQKA